jgi:hypothetical protein
MGDAENFLMTGKFATILIRRNPVAEVLAPTCMSVKNVMQIHTVPANVSHPAAQKHLGHSD